MVFFLKVVDFAAVVAVSDVVVVETACVFGHERVE
jgi:hypothetical protein